MRAEQPLGRPIYGFTPHLPASQLRPDEHMVDADQARMALVATRDRHDRVIVADKLDGACTGEAKIHGVTVSTAQGP